MAIREIALLIPTDQVEVRPRILRQPQRPLRAEDESPRADRTKELRELILGRPPNPGNVPEDAFLFLRREAPVHFLDRLAAGGGNDDSYAVTRARKRPNRGRAQVARDIERVTLAEILEADCQQERHTKLARRDRQLSH